jgi:hypothetical protein
VLDARPRARSVAGVEDVGDELVVLPLLNVPFIVATVVAALLVPRVALAALVVLLAAGTARGGAL